MPSMLTFISGYIYIFSPVEVAHPVVVQIAVCFFKFLFYQCLGVLTKHELYFAFIAMSLYIKYTGTYDLSYYTDTALRVMGLLNTL